LGDNIKMTKDLLENLIGRGVLIDEGLRTATYGILRALDSTHLELRSAIMIGVDNGRGQITGFESLVNYQGSPYHGRLDLRAELGQYFVNRAKAKRIMPYDFSKMLSEHLSDNERKRIESLTKP